MKNQSFLDCLVLVGTAVSLNVPEMKRPFLQDVFTTFVKVSVTVEEIVLDDYRLDLGIALLLNQNWLDPRLNANANTKKLAISGKIWEPKIRNIIGDQTSENMDDTLYWRGHEEGNVTLNRKFKLKTSCTNNLRDFPFDIQFCDIKFGSYRFPMEEVSLEWQGNPPIILFSKLKSSEFNLINVSTNIITEIRNTGNFSSAMVIFTIKRNPEHYFICIGIPSILMIFLSYLSTWTIKHKIQLILFSFCVHIYLFYFSTCLVFPKPYINHLNIFVGLSAIFSLCPLIESIVFENVCDEFIKQEKSTKMWFIVGKKILYPLFYVTTLVIYYNICKK